MLCKFKIKPTTKPDVYEVHTNDKEKHFHGYACLNTLATSKLVSALFVDNKNKEGVNMKCRFHTRFRKWIPEELLSDEEIYSKEKVISMKKV